MGPPNDEAELILAVFALGNATKVNEEIGGIELVVAEEFPSAAVELVGTGLDGCVENGAGRAADFGAVVTGLYFEFLNGIDGRADRVGSAV